MKSNLQISISSIADDSMKSNDGNYRSVLPVRKKFLATHGLSPTTATLVQVTYDRNDYCRYQLLSENDYGDGIVRDATIVADALVTQNENHVLFLPLADCIGAVIHDPVKRILMVSHLGRHNLEQFGGSRSVEYLLENFSCNSADLIVWLSPAAGKHNYPLYRFDNRSMHDVATEQLLNAGVASDHITTSNIDTTIDPNYFSHSQFLKGDQNTDGRFAIVARLAN